MNALGVLYQTQNKFEQAGALSEKVLEIRKRVMGEEHPDTLTSMNDLAVLNARRGQSAQAAELFTQVIDLQRRLRGDEHPETLRSMSNLGVLYRGMASTRRPSRSFSRPRKRGGACWETGTRICGSRLRRWSSSTSDGKSPTRPSSGGNSCRRSRCGVVLSWDSPAQLSTSTHL